MPWGALAGPAIPRRSPASPVPRPARCGADTQHVTWVALWLLDRDPARGPEVLRCFPPDRPGSPTPPELSWAARCPPSSCGLNRRGPAAPGAAGRPGTWPRLGLRAPLLPDRGPPWERWEAGWGGAMLPPSQTRAGGPCKTQTDGDTGGGGQLHPSPARRAPLAPPRGPQATKPDGLTSPTRPTGCRSGWWCPGGSGEESGPPARPRPRAGPAHRRAHPQVLRLLPSPHHPPNRRCCRSSRRRPGAGRGGLTLLLSLL